MLAGETFMASPVPAGVPPHEPVNHSVVAPVPFDPPSTVNVVLLPLQIVVVPVAPVGAVDNVFTVTVTVAQVVVLHEPLYRT